MYLKTLTLKGFKSFAEKTTLDLEPGITVVVGPNGSGKSNVVDAVAWVLGAQGPASLRSSKMEDVIFAGSGGRPALGRAEVSLTIDNSSGRLPVGLAEVTVSRTLWRSGESEYAMNGAPCRLLDISELLSDSGVGRHQHMIVSQGQLEAVLSARPEERRLVIEEAAGILKYRRRRERTERRMASTAGDLARCEDLVREVRSQLRPLERQAQAARRHDALVAESRAIRLFLAGQELAGAQRAADAAQLRCAELGAQSSRLRARLAEVDERVTAAEAVMAEQSVASNDVAIGSLDSLAERARGLAAVLEERRRSVARSLQSNLDGSVVAALEAEAERVRVELAGAELVAGALASERAGLSAEEAALAEATAISEARGPAGEGLVEPSYRVSPGEIRGRLGALLPSLRRESNELGADQASMATLDRRAAELSEALRAHLEMITSTEAASAALAGELCAAEQERLRVEQASSLAGEAVHAAETELQRWETRGETLAMALDQLRARGGAGHLAGTPGLLGTLAELVEVDHGWEAAFEAAVGDASASVVLADVAGAVAALERLAAVGASGSVIASRWADGRGGAEGSPSSDGSDAGLRGTLGGHVRAAHPAVRGILAKLLAPVDYVDADWRTALEWALDHPTTVVITKEGDRFGPDGWRVGTPGLGATGAALAEARASAAAVSELVSDVRAKRVSAEAKARRSRQAEADLASERDANARRLAEATSQARRAEAELARCEAEAESVRARLAALGPRLQRDSAEVAQLEHRLAELELAEAAGAEAGRRLSDERRDLEALAESLRARRYDLGLRSAGLDERRSLLASRLAEVEARLSRLVEARQSAAGRRQALEQAEVVTARLAGVVQGVRERLASVLDRLRTDRAARAALHEERVAAAGRLYAERTALGALLGESQEQFHAADLRQAEARFRLEAALASLARDLEVEPEAALNALCPELPPGLSAAQRAAQLDRELRLAGPVNPLAEAELSVLRERADLLDSQLKDVQSARSELSRVMRSIDTEMSGVFATAYHDTAGHFSHLFATLFSGGEGSLCLTEPDNLLETGIEVLARPAGKKVRSISLLSGGERSLVALAFLFAVFRSRPAPFYLLDEVEAALDDVNLQRFLGLIHEFRSDAQLIIVSHQRRTMEVADCLYGVSMPAGGSSRVVTERAPSPA